MSPGIVDENFLVGVVLLCWGRYKKKIKWFTVQYLLGSFYYYIRKDELSTLWYFVHLLTLT